MDINLRFIHIPKTAGLSILTKGESLGYKWARYDPLLDDKYFLIKIHGHNALCYADDDHLEYYLSKHSTFTIVRNPYDRTVSIVFWNVVIRKYTQPNTVDEFNEILYKIISQIQKPIIEHIETNNRQLPYWYPQTMWMYDKYNNLIIDYILHFESMHLDIQKLIPNFHIDHLNKSNRIFEITDISEENLQLINHIYKDDFKLLNYKMYNTMDELRKNYPN